MKPKKPTVEPADAAEAEADGARRKGVPAAAPLAIGQRPKLKIDWSDRVVERGETYLLNTLYSHPSSDALFRPDFTWGSDHYRFSGIAAPIARLPIRFGSLPGGKQCRITVAYSSGLQTAVRHTRRFVLDPAPVRVSIERPLDRQQFAP